MNTDFLRARLKLRHVASERELLAQHPLAAGFYRRMGWRPGGIRQHAAKLLASGALAGSLLLSPQATMAASQQKNLVLSPETATIIDSSLVQQSFVTDLAKVLPPAGQWELTASQEDEISKKIKDYFGVDAKAKLEGNKLNNDYGRMGAEQLLPRYPGDSAEQHDGHWDKGQTPGLGGWGYFAYSKDQMTPELYATEKYYVAVQTLYLPDWNTRTRELVAWYKYRRVLVVNPVNGKAVVAAVADAGPANWTGKHFGGSPEVMEYLGINYGMQNHPVVLFFLDDSGKKVPLGPLGYNNS